MMFILKAMAASNVEASCQLVKVSNMRSVIMNLAIYSMMLVLGDVNDSGYFIVNGTNMLEVVLLASGGLFGLRKNVENPPQIHGILNTCTKIICRP